MHEIICPHCGKAFKIDEAGYADILKQVCDSAFEQQMHERLELAEQDKRNAVEFAQAEGRFDTCLAVGCVRYTPTYGPHFHKYTSLFESYCLKYASCPPQTRPHPHATSGSTTHGRS